MGPDAGARVREPGTAGRGCAGSASWTASAAHRAAAAHPRTRITDSVDDVVADPDVTAVVVAVEAARHHAVGMQALLARKHLFVEKPLALRAHDAEELCATAGRARARAHRRTPAAAPPGDRARAADARRRRARRTALLRVATHDDRRAAQAGQRVVGAGAARRLAGAAPVRHAAADRHGGRRRTGIAAGDDNVASAVLGFADGKTAHIHVGRFADEKRREVLLAGTRATLTFDELAPGAGPATVRARPRRGRRRAVSVGTHCWRSAATSPRVSRATTVMAATAHTPRTSSRVLEAGERSMRGGGAAQRLVVSDGRRASFEAA